MAKIIAFASSAIKGTIYTLATI